MGSGPDGTAGEFKTGGSHGQGQSSNKQGDEKHTVKGMVHFI